MNLNEAPGKSRVERKKEKTRQKITAASMRLFESHGLEATTMEQIAEEADIAKGTLYNYFPSKEAIIGEFIQGSFRERNSERIRQLKNMPDTRSRLILIFSELFEGVQAQKEIFEKFLVYRMQTMVSFQQEESVKSGISLLANEIIEPGQNSAEIRDDLPHYMLQDLFVFAFIEVVKQFYMEPESFQPQESIEHGVDLFMHGAGPGSV